MRKMEYALNGAERGYKQPGKKLLNRYGHLEIPGRNNRERRRNAAREIEAYGGYEALENSWDLKVRRLRKKMSAKQRLTVERLWGAAQEPGEWEFHYKVAFQCLQRAQWRYWQALEKARVCQSMQDIDEQMLLNAV
jgi:hypothetical protein